MTVLSPDDYAFPHYLPRDGACEAGDCGDDIYARRLCRVHYDRKRRIGSVEKPARDIEQSFWAKVDRLSAGCWNWMAARSNDGYGRFTGRGRRQVSAHRFSYELLVGPVPEGLDLDHLCRNRACVNPAHLEPVTRRENLNRGRSFHREKTHCVRGHEFSPENTRRDSKGHRWCRACARERQR